MTIGENIKRVRKEKGLTQKELAKKLNVSEPMISQYESKETLKLETIRKIAKALDVYMSELISDWNEFSNEEIQEDIELAENYGKHEDNKYITKHNLNQLIEELSNINISFEYLMKDEEQIDEDTFFHDVSKDKLTFEIFNDHLELTLKELKQIKKACEKAYNDCLKLKFYEAYLNKEKLKGEEIED